MKEQEGCALSSPGTGERKVSDFVAGRAGLARLPAADLTRRRAAEDAVSRIGEDKQFPLSSSGDTTTGRRCFSCRRPSHFLELFGVAESGSFRGFEAAFELGVLTRRGPEESPEG